MESGESLDTIHLILTLDGSPLTTHIVLTTRPARLYWLADLNQAI
jgi:hypothetical protein